MNHSVAVLAGIGLAVFAFLALPLASQDAQAFPETRWCVHDPERPDFEICDPWTTLCAQPWVYCVSSKVGP